MAVLANQRQEEFARNIAKGMNGTEAYKAAGYSVASDAVAGAAASRLLANVKVQDRVAELQERAATGTVTTVETLLEACWGIIGEARAHKDYSAASQTLERAAKIAGQWIDRTKNDTNLNLGQALDSLPDD
jgi:phage terminase small subunit